MWFFIRIFFKWEIEVVVIDFLDVVIGFELDYVIIDDMVQNLKDYFWSLVEKKVREEVVKILI